jgi:hypothetical protein
MSDKAKTQAVAALARPVVDRQVVAAVVAQAQADGMAISGEGDGDAGDQSELTEDEGGDSLGCDEDGP